MFHTIEKNNVLGKSSQEKAKWLYVEIGDYGIDSIVTVLQNAITGDIGDMARAPQTLILYSTEGDSITNISSIYAISYLVLVNNQFEHHFLEISSGSSTSNTKFDATGDYITNSELNLLAETYSPDVDSFGYTMMRNLDISLSGPTPALQENELAKAVINALRNAPIDNVKGCKKLCSNDPSGICKYQAFQNPPWNCETESCRLGWVKNMGEDSSLTDPYNPLSLSQGYFYRDSLMENYAIGRKYIEYYYVLSHYGNAFKSTLNGSNLLQHVLLAYKLMDFCDKLKNASGSTVLVDSTLRSLALGLIDDYRQFTTNEELQEILDDITDDLDHFLNKTKTQVLSEI